MKSKKLVLAVAGLMASALAGSNANAQVRDVSVMVSPYASYNWWNSNIALKNSPFVGARVGFGFGPFFEIRANYEQSINLKNALQDKDWNPLNEEALQKLEGMDMTISRVGGEAKVNLLGNSAVTPYLTAGAGVQVLDYNPFKVENKDAIIEEAKVKDKQLYYTLGAGVKLRITDRMAFSMEARNLGFNMNANNSFINHYGDMKDLDKKKYGNWSALASFDFYLGGNAAPGTHQLGGRYASLFSDGFRGMKFVLEPGVQYVDFRNKTGLSDQWFLGGSAGVDFSSLVGLRAFYYQATKEPNKLSFDFNKDLKMYGANFIARLNYPRGIVPYLRFGAGYLDRNNLIESKDKEQAKENFKSHDLFGMLGAGIEIPISRWFALFGNADALLMTANDQKVESVSTPEDIAVNIGYTAGLRINLGDPVLQSELMDDTETVAYNERTNELRSDRSRVNRADVERLQNKMMTKKEFEEMVDRIMARIHEEESKRASLYTADETDVILRALATQSAGTSTSTTTTTVTSDDRAIKDLQARVGSLERDARSDNNGSVAPSTTIIAPGTGYNAPQPAPRGSYDVAPSERPVAMHPNGGWLKLNRLAAVTGVSLGESTSWALGMRGYMQISDSSFDFVPEIMFGFRQGGTSFDLAGNFVYNIDIKSRFTPYVGLGVGIFQHGLGTNFGTNIIAGTNINLGTNGEMFVDYTARSLFKNNQIAVGYRFIF
ncbi:outer membrane beta-barrel protein [uncultured Porphyromonas sp.]|uniref:outer membrane beta-barrel protein n=1 Tax=uncultured Porphyromonas sp. TaxID=159274 RepID=UPI00261E286B|nr:outer membrane beta-barrel protein [uncultured Porphyromonas sp.]